VKKIPPLGPAPTPAPGELPVEALDPSRRRLLTVIAEQAGSVPTTVGDLVATVGGHPNTTRHHLRVLLDARLVREEGAAPAAGRGRPAVRYDLTPSGRAVIRDDAAGRGSAAAEYVALAAAFAERLAERDGDPGSDARAIGRAWGTGLAATDADDVGVGTSGQDRVLGLLERLGFSPSAEDADGPGSGTPVLLRTCPLLDAARRHPEVVCQVHLGLVAGAIEAQGEPSDGLGLVPFARPGACVLTLPATLVG
jgi:predicted ArsR family transcriptional regulator